MRTRSRRERSSTSAKTRLPSAVIASTIDSMRPARVSSSRAILRSLDALGVARAGALAALVELDGRAPLDTVQPADLRDLLRDTEEQLLLAEGLVLLLFLLEVLESLLDLALGLLLFLLGLVEVLLVQGLAGLGGGVRRLLHRVAGGLQPLALLVAAFEGEQLLLDPELALLEGLGAIALLLRAWRGALGRGAGRVLERVGGLALGLARLRASPRDCCICWAACSIASAARSRASRVASRASSDISACSALRAASRTSSARAAAPRSPPAA